MNFFQATRMALRSIASNKMRSFLTMLGIIIGVAAVVMMVSLVKGSTNQVTSQIQGLGSNLVAVNVMGKGSRVGMSLQEAEDLGKREGIQSVAPVVSGQVTVRYNDKSTDTSMEGTTPDYENVRNLHVQSGRFLLPIDVTYRQPVILLGTDVVSELFGFVNPIGKYVKINGMSCLVVGVLETKGSSTMGSNDDKVILPISTAMRLNGTSRVSTAYIGVKNAEDVTRVVNALKVYLFRKYQDENAYNVFNQADILNTFSQITGTMTAMLGGIAGISLLVGGIGIMNIMLVSVTERTREIGIRKAIGAKRRDILTQFLVESLVIGATGGVLGILFGVSGANLIARLASIQVAFSLQIILIAFGFSLLVGVVFGIYPANKAARLNPIEALRYE